MIATDFGTDISSYFCTDENRKPNIDTEIHLWSNETALKRTHGMENGTGHDHFLVLVSDVDVDIGTTHNNA